MKKYRNEWASFYLMLIAVLSLFMINKSLVFAVIITVTLLALGYFSLKNSNNKCTYFFFPSAFLALIGGIFHIYWLNTGFQMLMGGLGLYFLTSTIKQSPLFKKICYSILTAVIGLVFLSLAVTAVTPKPFIAFIQKINLTKVDVSTEFSVSTLENGVTLYRNVDYNSSFPLGYLDIYKSNRENAPVFFYIHGGGYSAGDKVERDPDHTDSAETPWYFSQLIEAGYTIVSMNYALTPQHPYPTAISQVTEAVSFLQEFGGDYGIASTTYVFSGSSAGGNLAGQFVNLQTNEQYAAALGITPVLESSQIKAVVFNSALLDNHRFGKSNNGSLARDYLWFQEGRAYLHANYLDEDNASIKETNVIAHVTSNFPPAYISDANTGSFLDQAKDLHQKLNQLKVKNQLFHIPLSDGVTSHGYETTSSTYGRQNMKQLQLFLQELNR